MSIKIYNGLIAADPTDDIFSLIQKIRPVVTAHFRELSLEVIARTYAELAEDPKVREEVHPNRYLRPIADQRWYKQQRDLDPHARNHDPLRCQIVFGAVPDAEGGHKLLLNIFAEDPGYRQVLVDAGIVADYGYWDNVDQPEDLSADQWSQRREDWMHIVEAGDGSYAHLPIWDLPGTIDEVFYPIAGDHADFFKAANLNDYCTPTERILPVLRSQIMKAQLDTRDTAITGQELANEIQKLIAPVDRCARQIIAEHADEITAEPLPGIASTVGDLPAPITIPEHLITRASALNTL